MPVVQSGSFNPASLVVDNVYVVVTPPGNAVVQGVDTGRAGYVGGASWGPVNQPVLCGSPGEVVRNFGPLAVAPRDMPTEMIIGLQQGATSLYGVRVVDGTEAKASGDLTDGATVPKTIVKFTAMYFGTEGNRITCKLVPGKAANTYTLQVSRAGVAPESEVFENLPKVGLVQNIVNAVTLGTGPARGPSQLVTAAAVAGGYALGDTVTLSGSEWSITLAGGLNGDAAITTAQQLGSEAAIPETGMYALASAGVQQFVLCGLGSTDSAGWLAQEAFAKKIGAIACLAFPPNTSTSQAVAAKAAAGLDSMYAHITKDWVKFFDSANAQVRDISPAAFVLGKLASLSPEQSPGNKPMVGILATERTHERKPYTDAELALLINAGIGVITNPVPGGNYFALRHGLNASSDNTINGVEHTRMTNFLAYSLNNSFGKFIDRVQSTRVDDPVRDAARVAITNFLAQLKADFMIDDYSVDMSFGDGKVNTKESVAKGFMKAVVRVRYLSIVRFFTITLIGGRTVEVSVA